MWGDEPIESAFVGDPREGTLVGRIGPVLYIFLSGPSVEGAIDAQVDGGRQVSNGRDEVGVVVVVGPNAGFPTKDQRRRIVDAFRPWSRRQGATVMYHAPHDAFRRAVMRSIFTSMVFMAKLMPGAIDLSVDYEDEALAITVESKTGASQATVLEVLRWARGTLRDADPSYL